MKTTTQVSHFDSSTKKITQKTFVYKPSFVKIRSDSDGIFVFEAYFEVFLAFFSTMEDFSMWCFQNDIKGIVEY